MSKKSNLTIQEAFDLFIRKCRIKNLTDLSISSYEKKMVHFYEFIDKNESIKTVIKDTVDDYILWLCENTEANDTTINSYLRSLRAFLYYCMECNYSSFSCCYKTWAFENYLLGTWHWKPYLNSVICPYKRYKL